MRSFSTFVLVIAGGVLSKSDQHYRLKESVTSPVGWVEHSTPDPDHTIHLHFALPQPNFWFLEQTLYEISNPSNVRYGQHMSKEEIEASVAPNQDSINVVEEWITSHGISDIRYSAARDSLKVSVSVRKAEEMLNTNYSVWEHVESKECLVRTTQYSLPVALHDHVDFVQPTILFSRLKESKSMIASMEDAPTFNASTTSIEIGNGIMVDPSCNSTITLSCLMQLYNSTGFEAQGNGSIGITGYLEEFANIRDLQSFFAEQRPDAVGSFTFVSVAGGLNNQSLAVAGGEANLDTQFGFGISYPTPATFYSTAGRAPYKPGGIDPPDTNEPYLDWLDYILAHSNPPLVISTSYGDVEQSVPESFAIRACRGFARLGARGVSVIFSSGDGGVGDGDPNPATQRCFTNDGRNATRFMPNFPASCPFVTAVGGTDSIPEVAVSAFFSGGGFSDIFSRPEYQDKAVSQYLSALPNGTYAGLFNPRGRAYPDVSAQSHRYRVWVGGKPVLISGTSASSPAFAGFIALLNDARLSQGLPPLGFLNPLIYSAQELFNDITIGNNPGCGTTGFNATEGWDPVTGVGTPNFGKLLAHVTRSGCKLE